MGFFANRSIKFKLGLAFFALLSVSVLLGVSGTVGNAITQLELRHLSREALVNVATATKIERMAAELRLDALAYALAGHGPDSAIAGAFDDLDADLAALRGRIGEIDTPDLTAAYAAFATRVGALAPKPWDGAGIAGGAGDVLTAGDALRRAIEDAQSRATEDAFASVTHAQRTGWVVALVSTAVFLLGSIMAVAVVVLTGRHLTRPLARIADVLHRVSRNEDGIVIADQDRGDEIGALALAAEGFREVLARERGAEQRAGAERTAAQAARDTAQDSARAAEQARREAEAARNFHAKKAAIADAFFEAFSRIISHAERGDFSQRIGIRFNDENYDTLTYGANLMMEAIEAGLWETGAVVGDLAAGRLNTAIEGVYEGDFATLKDNVNATAHQLRGIVEKINETGVLVTRDADLLSTNAARLSRQSAAQTASIGQTGAALAEVTEMTTSNTVVAESMATQARLAAQQARSGSDVVEKAIAAMAAIEASQRKVTEIVSVIDGISFQTNLLALNAGIEAARAGEAGRGFMVVAQEVRGLAGRASEAAREIDRHIGQSGADVQNGVEMVRSTGAVLKDIVEAVATVDIAADKITASSHDQASRIRAVTAAMQDLDRITQSNATAAEETAHAAQRLNATATQLESQLTYFRDDHGMLKSGLERQRPARETDWREAESPERRSEPYVGASIPARPATGPLAGSA